MLNDREPELRQLQQGFQPVMTLCYTLTKHKCPKIGGHGRVGTIKSKDSWRNYAVVTYDMNRLQNLAGPHQFFVTLNTSQIDPDTILGHWTYAHPQFGPNSLRVQSRIEDSIRVQGLLLQEPGVATDSTKTRGLG